LARPLCRSAACACRCSNGRGRVGHVYANLWARVTSAPNRRRRRAVAKPDCSGDSGHRPRLGGRQETNCAESNDRSRTDHRCVGASPADFGRIHRTGAGVTPPGFHGQSALACARSKGPCARTRAPQGKVRAKSRGIKSPPLWADGSCHHRSCGPYGAGGSPAPRRRLCGGCFKRATGPLGALRAPRRVGREAEEGEVSWSSIRLPGRKSDG
jgi:hypothetical protein